MDNTAFEHKVRKKIEQLIVYDSFKGLNQSGILDNFDYNPDESVLDNIKRIIIEYDNKTGKKLELVKI